MKIIRSTMDLGHLQDLIKDGNNDEAKPIIERLDLYNTVDGSGSTLLHHAAKHGNWRMTKCLLEKGCNVNAQDNLGNTPLMEALLGRHFKVVEAMLEAAIDIFITNHENKNSLHFLFEKRGNSIVKLVLNQFQKLCPSGPEEAASRLIDGGCELYEAVFVKNAEIIEYMMQHGFSSNSTHGREKETALHAAARVADSEITRVLLKYGADPNVKDTMGMSPMYLLSMEEPEDFEEETKILKLFLDADALPLLICEGMGTFQCFCALQFGPREAVRILLESGLDFTIQDWDGRTVLHYLASNVNCGIDLELQPYAANLDVSIVDDDGMSPIHLAAYYANALTLQFLLEHKSAKINLLDKLDGKPALFYAYTYIKQQKDFSAKCAELLIESGADLQIVANEDGRLTTIFDLGMKWTSINRHKYLKLIVARLAFIKKLGTPITEIIKTKINAKHQITKYFEQCQEILDKNIAGTVKFLTLVTADKKKMAKYLNNKEVVENMVHVLTNQEFTSSFPYYKKMLMESVCEGEQYLSLKGKAAKVLSECSKGLFAEDSIITNLLIDNYFDTEELKQFIEL